MELLGKTKAIAFQHGNYHPWSEHRTPNLKPVPPILQQNTARMSRFLNFTSGQKANWEWKTYISFLC